MVVTLLYEMQTPCNCLLYHYALAIVVEAIIGEMKTTLRWRSRCRASGNGYHDDALEMEIKSTR